MTQADINQCDTLGTRTNYSSPQHLVARSEPAQGAKQLLYWFDSGSERQEKTSSFVFPAMGYRDANASGLVLH